MEQYDFVVVGAGTAGCVIASRLAERTDAQVLLLESGTALSSDQVRDPQAWPTLRGTAADWGDGTVVQAETGLAMPYPRGRGLGGSSSINAMLFARGYRWSYDTWASLGVAGWGFADLLPYFKRSETAVGRDPALRGTDGPLKVGPGTPRNPFVEACAEAAAELGYRRAGDISGGLEDGFGRVDQNIVDGRRQSAADAYLARVESRPNLRVVTGAMVTTLHLTGDECTGLEYRAESGDLISVMVGREIVLTAGAIGSAQLLMLSGIGDEDQLRAQGIPVTAHLPGVGSNLQDHATCVTVFVPPEGVSPRIDHHMERVAGLVRSDLSTGAPDLQLLFTDNPAAGPNQAPPARGYGLRVSVMSPHSRGTVRLANGNPGTLPVIDPRYYSDRRDLLVMRDGLRIARELGRSKSLGPWRAAEFFPGSDVREDAELDAYVRASLGSYHHPVGTCRMGTDPHAVVDAELRVRGIRGLRVADASVMPTIPTANTNATVYAIAERAADLLAA